MSHDHCGTRNPFVMPLWAMMAFGWTGSVLIIIYRNLLPMLMYLPWLFMITGLFWWEWRHSLRKMYQTWRP